MAPERSVPFCCGIGVGSDAHAQLSVTCTFDWEHGSGTGIMDIDSGTWVGYLDWVHKNGMDVEWVLLV